MLNIHGGEPEFLAEGLYELLHTKELAERVETQPELQASFETVADDLSPGVLASYIASQARRALAAAPPADRVAVANSILSELQGAALIQDGPQQLTSLFPPEGWLPVRYSDPRRLSAERHC